MQDSLIFKVKGNEYTIKFPTVGEYRRIESLKQVLSNGMYNSLINTTTDSAQGAADMIDIEATITVLSPELMKDLKCESFNDLGLKDYSELRSSYIGQFTPWWNGIMKEIGLRNE